jgi:hypothetical protein
LAIPDRPEQVIDILYMIDAGAGEIAPEIPELVLDLLDLIVRDQEPRVVMSHACHTIFLRTFIPVLFSCDIVLPMPESPVLKRCSPVLHKTRYIIDTVAVKG